MWAYSLSLGGSHALLNDWVNNERLMNRLTPEERSAVEEARRRATRRESAADSADSASLDSSDSADSSQRVAQ